LSNLFKGAFISYDGSDARIIDNNALSDQKIVAFQEQELKRHRTQMVQEDGFNGEFQPDFVPGIDMEQLNQLTEDQNMFGAVNEEPQVDMEAVQAEIDFKLQQAQEQAQAIIEDANNQADEVRANAAAMGRQEGYDAGYQEGLAAVESMKADIELQKESLEKEYQQIVDELEPEMVDALTQIYEHVFGIEFREDKGIILHLLKNTLSRIEPGNDLIVHISSDDFDDVMEEKESLDACITSPSTTMEIIEDPLLKENECMIESDSGVFDCSLGVELSELSRKLKLLSFDRKKR
jgi:flagellar assembly protein FliH